MTVALSVYATNTNSAVLASARKLVATAGTPSTNAVNSTCGNVSTGYSSLFSQGTANPWGSFAGIQTPNGAGFVLEAAALNLAGFQFPAGLWKPMVRAKTSIGTLSVDIYVPVYVYNSGTLGYTLIGTPSLLGQTITVTSTNFPFVGSTLPLQNFNANDLLYWEVWFNITANNTGNAAATTGIIEAISTTLGHSISSCRLDTPGFQSQTPGQIVARQRMMHFGKVY